MGLETFALINSLGQVINHIVVDKEADNFEEVMAGQLEHWDCTRYIETTEEKPVIILDADPEIWTTHCDNPDCEKTGFNLPEIAEAPVSVVMERDPDIEIVVRKKSELPEDSLLLEENAANRPEGWIFPLYVKVIEG
jgi:hypothetical protein